MRHVFRSVSDRSFQGSHALTAQRKQPSLLASVSVGCVVSGSTVLSKEDAGELSGPHYFNQPTLSLVGSREVLLVDGDDVVFLVRACSFNGTLQKPVIRLVCADVLIVGGEGDRREDEATIGRMRRP